MGGGATIASTPSRANRRKSEPGMGHVALAPGSPERSPVKPAAIAITSPSLKKFQPELGQMRSPPDEWKRSRLSHVVSEEQHHQDAQTSVEPDDEYDDIPVQESDLALYQQYNKEVQDSMGRVSTQAGETAAERLENAVLQRNDGGANGDSNKSIVAITHSTRDVRETDDNGAVARSRGHSPAWKNLTQLACLLLAATISFPALRTWQKQSVQIGYCDTGSVVNNRILQERQRRAKLIEWQTQVIENPQAQVAARPDEEAFYEVLGIAPPESCTPCPEHAICQDGKLARCAQGYQLVSDWRQTDFVKVLFDGLPGVGPVAFPPSCQIDFKRKALGAIIAKEIESDLAKRHGDVLCSKGLGSTDAADHTADAAHVIRDGMSEQDLRNMLFAKVCCTVAQFPG